MIEMFATGFLVGGVLCWFAAMVAAMLSLTERFQNFDLDDLAFYYVITGWVGYILGIILGILA